MSLDKKSLIKLRSRFYLIIMIAPVLWFTGLSGSGKSTIARAVELELREKNITTQLLDGDDIRRQFSHDLGFSHSDRAENVRRISALAEEASRKGALVLIAAISPYREIRAEIRRQHPCFLEIFVNAPLEICEQRDPKGLYARARSGAIRQFTGISDVYEEPYSPDVECRTDRETVEASCAKVIAGLERVMAKISRERILVVAAR